MLSLSAADRESKRRTQPSYPSLHAKEVSQSNTRRKARGREKLTPSSCALVGGGRMSSKAERNPSKCVPNLEKT